MSYRVCALQLELQKLLFQNDDDDFVDYDDDVMGDWGLRAENLRLSF